MGILSGDNSDFSHWNINQSMLNCKGLFGFSQPVCGVKWYGLLYNQASEYTAGDRSNFLKMFFGGLLSPF
jgi:hypothetical protein